MNTKTCKRCGWVYPITQPGVKCRICGTPFDIVVCSRCGTFSKLEDLPNKNSTQCRSCYRAIARDNKARLGRVRYERFLDRKKTESELWLDKVRRVPKNYPTLSEEQWIDVCRFFGGCARCGSSDVDTRGFFISHTNGGRYCDWNIIPLCERCAMVWNTDKNQFLYTVFKDYNDRAHGEYQRQLQRIKQYLEAKLDAAVSYRKEEAE